MDSPKPKLQHYGWEVGGGINCPCMATRKNLPSYKNPYIMVGLYINYQLLCTDYYLFIKY